MTTRARRKPRAQAEGSPPPPPPRVLVGRVVVQEDPSFDPADLCGPEFSCAVSTTRLAGMPPMPRCTIG